jgi:subtilisin family serine protease
MDLRIFKKDGSGTLFNGLCAISYAIQKNANLINMSWGSYFMDVDTLFLDYIRKAKTHNITIVASAGNDTIDTDHCLHFPSGFNSHVFGTLGNVLGVASLNNDEDGFAYYSNFGKTTVGIAASQGSIDGTVFEGTSFSAPVVTNHIINMMFKDPSKSNVEIVNCIKNSAITIPGLEVISEGKLDVMTYVCP